jgi:hypothetical protein
MMQLKRTLIAGVATAAFVSGGLGLAGFELATGNAQAQPISVPEYNWCPGQPWQYTIPAPPDFDWTVCHQLTAKNSPDGRSATIVEVPDIEIPRCPPTCF